MLRWILRACFERLPLTLGASLGLAQLVVALWLCFVLDLTVPLPAGALVALAVVLAASNAWLLRLASRCSGPGHPARHLAVAHIGLGFVTLVVATAVTTAFGAVLGLSAVLAFTGAGPDLAASLFRVTSVGAAGASLLWAGWGFTLGGARIVVSRVAVPVAGLAPALGGLRIAHLTDLHIGNGLEGERIARIVRRVAALEPDLVVLTGDLFDRDPEVLADGARRLGALRAPLGVFAVLGNHDAYTGVERVAAALAEHAPGIRVLRGTQQRLDTPAPLHVAGVDDPAYDWVRRGRRLAALDALGRERAADGPTLLLVHRPDAFEQAAELGFALVLSGHYHGGQVALPLRGGRWNAARALTPYSRGLFHRNATTLYVSRGLGFAGPRIRVGAPREIALLELTGSGGRRGSVQTAPAGRGRAQESGAP
ncbi:MAG: metallophosphoesterase [Myxococcota bacterium]|nr:metallophosphoesterase [Myxococcota bacterium]